MHILIYLLIGGLAGMVAGKIMSGHGYGILGDIGVGIVGGVIGGWLMSNVFHHQGSGYLWEFLVALLGACILVAILRLVRGESIRR